MRAAALVLLALVGAALLTGCQGSAAPQGPAAAVSAPDAARVADIESRLDAIERDLTADAG